VIIGVAGESLYHFPRQIRSRIAMLVIVDLTTKVDSFPFDSLREIDAALAALRFKKEVYSVVKPGRQYSVTYDGPSKDKSEIEEILRPVAERNQINLSVQIEESVRFP
jgi:hypothetical protein